MDDHRPEPAPPDRLRASDAERDQVIEELNRHAGEGRLTLDELSDRIEQAAGAKTHAELVPLTADLPTEAEVAVLPPRRGHPLAWDIAVMGGNDREGRFWVGDRFRAIAFMGGSDIDLRNAVFDAEEIVITIYAMMGGTTIYLPDSVEVQLGGFALMGGNSQRGSARAAPPGAPVIKVNAYTLMGGSEVWRLPVETRGLPLKQAKKAAKRLELE
ncbi:DUF1707 SHOCT-like domain-containing protein [Microlunatus speluncae]|uniref:DUF1707 SHOCT-like domain-containing protein n=1 Tax=Microlunatus speluncae TaxID=2594267 RepID=UPI00137601C1|nr:DUF1707 domain-containing protein [Microlunatus speluncae]